MGKLGGAQQCYKLPGSQKVLTNRNHLFFLYSYHKPYEFQKAMYQSRARLLFQNILTAACLWSLVPDLIVSLPVTCACACSLSTARKLGICSQSD